MKLEAFLMVSLLSGFALVRHMASYASSEFVAVYITAPSPEIGQSLANLLIEKKLAACVNAIPSIVSTYRWEGKVETSTETLLMAKTRSELVPAVAEAIKSAHPYSVPEVIATPIVGGLPAYLDWIRDSTAPDA
eukprot:m.235045 g.235045  ORF g.235045 m.235045 type:complete len:134 (+) comp19870_c0_seq1:148-549(+)